jgi:hypothetical protein
VSDQRGGDLVAGAEEVGDGVAVLFEQGSDLGVDVVDALVERVDVSGELADDGGGDGVGQAVAEADALELAQLALALAAQRRRFGDGVDLLPGRAQPLDGHRAVANEAMAFQLQQPERADELGFERRAERVAAAQDDLRDRVRVARVGLARTEPASVAVRAPRRHVEDLKARAGQRRRERPAESGWVLDADDRGGRVVFDEPGDQLAIAVGTVGEQQRVDQAAASVEQRGGVTVLVAVDADEQPR